MDQDKIRVSWEEVQSAKVDEALKHQDALARAQVHVQQQGSLPPTPNQPQGYSSSIWYNTLFYMGIFGVIGGLLAWMTGEIAWKMDPKQFVDFQEAVLVAQEVEAAIRDGRMTEGEGNSIFQRLESQLATNSYFQISSDKTIPQAERDKRIKSMSESDQTKMTILNLIWMSLCGVFLGLALSVAEPIVSRNYRAAVINGSVGATLGLLGGIGVSLFVNNLYQAMVGGGSGVSRSLFHQILARGIAWSILGAFLSLGPGIVMKNGKKLAIGLTGGVLGGLLGGIIFDPIAIVTSSAPTSRLFGIVSIGGLAGLGTGLIENAAKTGWLRVLAGLIAGKQFILYRNPTYVGSSPQCEIYLFKDLMVRPRHAAIHIVSGGFEIENQEIGSGTFVNGQAISRVRLRNGDHIQIGSTTFVFQEKSHASV